VNPLGPPSDLQANQPTADPQIVEMLAGMNATADMLIVQRTRRAVMQAAAELREQRQRKRRNMAVVLLTIAVLAMVLTPAIWSTVDDFLGGEQWFELPGMVMVLVLLLFSTIAAALIIGFKGQQQMHGRR
jgi:protein-S-isoprenylcysteine O-methyltransferase Ste14